MSSSQDHSPGLGARGGFVSSCCDIMRHPHEANRTHMSSEPTIPAGTELIAVIERNFESKGLDYKGPCSWAANDKKSCCELAKDIMAMANTEGGYIVIGVLRVSCRLRPGWRRARTGAIIRLVFTMPLHPKLRRPANKFEDSKGFPPRKDVRNNRDPSLSGHPPHLPKGLPRRSKRPSPLRAN